MKTLEDNNSQQEMVAQEGVHLDYDAKLRELFDLLVKHFGSGSVRRQNIWNSLSV
ncbi:MAG: hypothetical protein HQL31_13080 [Planctomycetes bacterium]|nr:hypothetical protein [Planctomycetota bacterium]